EDRRAVVRASVPDRDRDLLILLHAGHELVRADRRVVEREQVAVLVAVREGTELEGLIGLVVPRTGPLDAGDVCKLTVAIAAEGGLEVATLVVDKLARRGTVPHVGGEADAAEVVVTGERQHRHGLREDTARGGGGDGVRGDEDILVLAE